MKPARPRKWQLQEGHLLWLAIFAAVGLLLSAIVIAVEWLPSDNPN